MKKITLLLAFLLFYSLGSYAQCIRTYQFPGDPVVSNNLGIVQTIADCSYTNNDYAVISNIAIGEDYVFTCTAGTTEKYITVTDADNNILASGESPLTVEAITASDIRLHYSIDAACAGATGCNVTTLQVLLQCPTPLDAMVDNITTTSADFTWTPGGSETAWEVLVLPASAGTPTSSDAGTAVSTNPAYTVSNLSPSLSYAFYVRANCGSDFSPWGLPVNFNAACLPTAGFSENFDSADIAELPNCWSTILRGETLSEYAYVTKVNFFVHSGPSSVELYNSDSNTTGADDIILVSPNLSTLSTGTYRLKFYAANQGSLQIGTLDSSSNGATFNMIEEIATTADPAQYTVDFSSYNGTDTYIGIRHNSGTYTSIYLDDLLWEPIPSCPDVSEISVSDILTSGATVNWTAGGAETSWNVAVGSPSDTDPSTLTAQTAAAATLAVGGLSDNTSYKVWVRSVCAGNDNGAWIGPVSFTTACIATATFNENFDSTETPDLPSCWSKILRGDTLSDYASITTGSGNNVHSDPNSVALYNSSSNTAGSDDIILVSPNLSTLGAGTHRMKFFAKGFGTLQVGTIDGNTDTSNFTMLEEVTTASITAEYTVDFTSYTGTDTYIAIRMANEANYSTVYLDDIRWELAPTCADVSDIMVTATTTSGATIEWAAGADETNWNVAVGAESVSDPNTLTAQATTALTFSASGLSDGTPYKVWVRSVCAGNDNGAWIGPVIFKTDCLAVALLNENFDGVTTPDLPNCWTSILRGDTLSDYAYVATADFSTVASAPNFVELYNSSSNTLGADDVILVSPNLSTVGAGTHRLKFTAMSQGSVQVGTLDSNTNSATFNMIQEFATTDDAAQYVADFTSYTGTDHYIGIRLNTPTYTSVYVDNIIWELAPSCPDVTEIMVSDITTATAAVNWTPGESETQWQVAYALSSVTDPSTILNPMAISNNPTATISGLDPATTYKVWVRSVCAGNDNGAWIGPITFMTLCNSTAVPYTEDFESVDEPALPGCASSQNLSNGNSWTTYNSPGNGFNSNTLRYRYNTSNAANAWFYTQGINLAGGTEYKIKYRYGQNDGGGIYHENFKVMYGTSPNADDMTNEIADHPDMLGVNSAVLEEVTFTPDASGVYYFGFNSYSNADQNYIFVDDINVDTALSTGNPETILFSYYPNPVKDALNISYQENITGIAVYNLLGQKVLEEAVNANSAKINMSGLSAGSYIVKVKSENQTKTIKIIKQ